MIDNNGVATLYYGYTDNQGSLIALTDESGNPVEKYAYDPWGARRNPTNWTLAATPPSGGWGAITNRGYTGHEYLDAFGLINMNGRIYDPLTAQFMSPDPFIQSPDNWVNYNRYGYCSNNPMLYTDPSGYKMMPADQGWELDAYGSWSTGVDAMHNYQPGAGGGGARNWTGDGYIYDYNTKQYINQYGDMVNYSEVYGNYILPNSKKDYGALAYVGDIFRKADETNQRLANINQEAKNKVYAILKRTSSEWDYIVQHSDAASNFFKQINEFVDYLSFLEIVSNGINTRIINAISDSRNFLGSKEFGSLGALISSLADYKEMHNGQISIDRFYYRLSGTGSSIATDFIVSAYIGGRIGGAYGALGGLGVYITFKAGESGYDMLKDAWYRWPDQFNYFINNTSNGYYNLNPNKQ